MVRPESGLPRFCPGGVYLHPLGRPRHDDGGPDTDPCKESRGNAQPDPRLRKRQERRAEHHRYRKTDESTGDPPLEGGSHARFPIVLHPSMIVHFGLTLKSLSLASRLASRHRADSSTTRSWRRRLVRALRAQSEWPRRHRANASERAPKNSARTTSAAASEKPARSSQSDRLAATSTSIGATARATS